MNTYIKIKKTMKKTIRSSNISSLLGEKRKWLYQERACKRSKYTSYVKKFDEKTKIIYFPHGNLLEDEAIASIDMEVEPQRVEAMAFNEYEKTYGGIINHPRIKFEAQDGIGSRVWKAADAAYNLSARPDGYIGEHILEVKCPWGGLRKTPGSTALDETFDIPINHRLQMFIEMLCHGKKKGYYLQYYDPSGWQNFFKLLHIQYWGGPKIGETVYKPWITESEFVWTIIDSVMKADIDANLFKTYLGDIPIPTGSANQANKIEYQSKYYEEFLHLISLTTRHTLMKHGFNIVDANIIMQKLTYSNGMKSGVVLNVEKNSIGVLWSGEKVNNVMVGNNYTTMPLSVFRNGILKILSVLQFTITRKDLSVWKPWESSILNGIMPKELPELNAYAESVMTEMDLSNEQDFFFMETLLKKYLQGLKDDPAGTWSVYIPASIKKRCTVPKTFNKRFNAFKDFVRSKKRTFKEREWLEMGLLSIPVKEVYHNVHHK